MNILQYLKSVIGPKPPEISIPPEYPLRQPLYDAVTIKLDKARSYANPEQRRECFKELYVEKADGTAFIRLSDKNAGEIKLKQGLILYSKVDVEKWYLVNDAQADKEINLILTKDIDFFLREKQTVRISQLIDILEHAKVMYLEADKIKSGNLIANIIISSVLKTAEKGACIVIDGASAIPEIKAYNDDPKLSDKTWDEINETWDSWKGKWDASQTLSIKADGSGWIGELINGKRPISWDTNGKVEIQVAYIKGLIATLIVAGFITADTITANLITTGILKSKDGLTYFDLDNSKIVMKKGLIQSIDGKTFFDLDKSEIVTVHPDNPDKRIKYSGGGIRVSEDGGVNWFGAIVYNPVTGKVGFDMTSGVMGQLSGSLLELGHLYAYDDSQMVIQSSNNTEYHSTTEPNWVERGSTGNITVAVGQTETEIYFSLRTECAFPYNPSYAPRIKIQICDTSNNVKKEWIEINLHDSYQYWSYTEDITQWFSEGQQFKVRRFLIGWEAESGGFFWTYSHRLRIRKTGMMYPLTYK